MALVNCHECGKSVSTEAKKCPSCGATVKLPKKPTSKLVWALLGVIVVSAVVVTYGQRSDLAAVVDAEAVRVAAMTPEQLAKEKVQKDKNAAAEKVRKDNEARTLNAAATGAKSLKQNSKDPQTFEFVSITTHPNSSVCYTFRGKNSFNAMLAGSAVLAGGKLLIREASGEAFVNAWNKNCTKADGEDVMAFIEGVIAT